MRHTCLLDQLEAIELAPVRHGTALSDAVALAAGLVEFLASRRYRGGRGADEFRPRRRSDLA
jgi:hypothetical protein